MSKWARSLRVTRVSSAAMRSASRRVLSARSVISSRLPIGVATRTSMGPLYPLDPSPRPTRGGSKHQLVADVELVDAQALAGVALGEGREAVAGGIARLPRGEGERVLAVIVIRERDAVLLVQLVERVAGEVPRGRLHERIVPPPPVAVGHGHAEPGRHPL